MSLLKKIYFNFETYICVVLIGIMILSLTAQVVVRIVTGGAIAWAEEVSRFSFICAVYLGTAVAAQKLAHVRVTAQFMFMPWKARLVFRIIADTILFAFNVFLAVFCFDLVANSIQYGELSATLGVNIAYVEAAIPVGAVLMNWRMVETYILHWRAGTLRKMVAVETDIGLGPGEGAAP
ncbi:MAG: TRAP transporter small permease [Candidatus Accumulibacter sp.]|jgi:TRAP-type C4-dicarboxylate transport system permease small subunit|nr:TRAP transporter small permease [Accumulibacter sp.]